ncbi:MAG: TatD family deoxyribonuclease [Dehalococcoidia bacterium]|nr:MAG: TatD family deoxyribonuclease [Dehalococcoidia bacterium]
MLVDSHAHIDAPRFDKDRDQVLARAKKVGVSVIINAGFDLGSSGASIKLAQRYAEVFVALGFHPHNAAKMKDGDLERLAELAKEPKVVAIGEIGLDFYRNLSPREAQIKAFKRQLELAQRLGLPVIIHSRNAEEEVLSILTEWAGRPQSKPLGVLHCFSGDTELGERYIEMGFLLSIAGPVTYSSSHALEIAHDLPLDKLLIETDCPFLTPVPYRGKRNEPAYLPLVAERIGQIRGMSSDLVAEGTTQNAINLFRLPLQAF